MKKIISIVSAVLAVISVFVLPASAADIEGGNESIAYADALNNSAAVNEPATAEPLNVDNSLITGRTLTLTKTNSGLKIDAGTTGASGVTKCGYTELKLQRVENNAWVDVNGYIYPERYSNGSSMTFTVTAAPAKGYTYRLTCRHYAEKKRLFGTDTCTLFNATSSVVY